MKDFDENKGKMMLSFDTHSLDIYIENGADIEPTYICYWNSDEWEEDAETVVPAMLRAMFLYYTNQEELLKIFDEPKFICQSCSEFFPSEEMDFDDENDCDLCNNCNYKSFNEAPYGED